MVKALFWISLFFIGYIYIGYPVIAALLSLGMKRNIRKSQEKPSVTVLIAAFNEQDSIEATVRNKLEQDYPPEKLSVVVISDGSTDKTDEIVLGINDSRLQLIRQEPRAGKTSALNLAVTRINSEIIVFSDANSIYAPDTIQRLVQNFSDPEVGYVTGKMIYANPDGTTIGAGCTAYMRYENVLREIETRLGSIVGVDGGVDAVRRKLYQPMTPDQLPDFVLPLKVVAQGYRVVYDNTAMLWETSLKDASDEYRMRVRVSLRAMWALFDMRQLLKFNQNPLFSWQLWSHKVLRYLCFLFLIIFGLSNVALLGKGAIYNILFMIQSIGYLAALIEPQLARKGHKISLAGFARYFALINLAAAHAFFKFLTGKKQVLWTPRKG